MICYFCKYTPLELLSALGISAELPNGETGGFRHAEELLHSSLCSHAMLLAEHLAAGRETEGERQELLLTSCCNSVCRVYDSLPEQADSFRMLLNLPHTAGEQAVARYAKELLRFMDAYRSDLTDMHRVKAHAHESGHYEPAVPDPCIEGSGFPRRSDPESSGIRCRACLPGGFDRSFFLKEWESHSEVWRALKRQRDYAVILGARVSDELRTKIRDCLPWPVMDLSCGGLRTLPSPPEAAAKKSPDGQYLMSDEMLMQMYASALLHQLPCTRMDDQKARRDILQLPGLRAVIYHSVRFCDFYSFEYGELAGSCPLPLLKLESDFSKQGSAQLETRILAFAESLAAQKETAETHTEGTQDMKDAIYIGIDSGSATTAGAAIASDGSLIASAVIRTGPKAAAAAERVLDSLRKQLGNRAEHIRHITATGYGRAYISFADDAVTEISCHARGAHALHAGARTIIDIGGQDSKVISLDEDGQVLSFIMNDKCAAGTGRFLEMMAQTLGMRTDEMAEVGLVWERELTISSTCTVFAESEVVGLIAENASTPDIIHALNRSVAEKCAGMLSRLHGSAPYMMTGGVARNRGVVQELERRLGSTLFITPEPDLVGAYGAALYARDAKS